MKRGFFRFFLIVLIMVIIQQCGGKTREALKYNDTIVKYQTDIVVKTFDLIKSLQQLDADMMDRKLATLQDQIDQSIEGVKRMAGFEENVRFRDAAVKLMEFYQDISENEYVEMIDILKQGAGNITTSDVEYMKELQDKIEQREVPLDREMQSAQREFANKYNLKIKTNKLQKDLDKL